MFYFTDFLQNLTKKANIGLLIYLIFNVYFIVNIFIMGCVNTWGDTFPSVVLGIIMGIAVYAASLMIALSSIGERILRFQTGCKKLKRKEHINRLEPLFNEVYAKAKELNPSIADGVQLFISNDEVPNAFATGRKTICVTKGFLQYSDEEIKATLAHEFGHLAHKDTDLILVVTIGNFIATAIFIFFRVMAFIVGMFFGTDDDDRGVSVVTVVMDAIIVAMMWCWTKIGTLLVMHSSRQTEFLADEFAFNLGYGDSLAAVLDSFQDNEIKSKGLWATLNSSHPDSDDRIARLQELGATYLSA